MINTKEITVGYWSTKGLGSVCRQMVIFAQVQLKSKTTEEISKAAGNFGLPGFKWPF